MKTACVILAGGAGKRMKSERPKVLAEVLCKPMLGWVLDAAEDLGFDEVAVVTGFGAELTGGYVSSRGGNGDVLFCLCFPHGIVFAAADDLQLIERDKVNAEQQRKCDGE